MAELEERQRQLLTQLYPSARGEESWRDALDTLLQAERERRGGKEERTGAYARSALLNGPLLEKDYDHSLHGHTGWRVGALVVDVQRLIRFNVRYGFPVGDAVLRAVVSTLEWLHPQAKIVRIHTDAFAALFTPWSEVRVDEALRERSVSALIHAVQQLEAEAERQRAERGGEAEGPRPEAGFTAALLELEVMSPSHWQVLGPLVWGEAERALVVERSGEARGVQQRRIDLGGTV